MAHPIAIFLATCLYGGVLYAQPQEKALGYLTQHDQGLSKASDGQQRRAALREATTPPKTAPNPNAPALPAGRQLSPQERAELRQQLRHQRTEAMPKKS